MFRSVVNISHQNCNNTFARLYRQQRCGCVTNILDLCEIAANTESGHVRLDNSISLFVLLSVFVYLLRLEKKSRFDDMCVICFRFFCCCCYQLYIRVSQPQKCVEPKAKAKIKKNCKKSLCCFCQANEWG